MTSREETEELSRRQRPPGALDVRSPGPLTAAGDSEDDRPEADGPGELTAAAPPVDGDGPASGTGTGRRRRRVRMALIVVIAIGVAAAAGLAATGALGGEDTEEPAAGPSGPAATARVERTTLTGSETVDGTLGYGDVSTVQAIAPAGGGTDPGGGTGQPGRTAGSAAEAGGGAADTGAGIVTWTPNEGTTISRGETVYGVDGAKIPLFYGDTPLYRTLSDGSEGGDVELLERNLAELGYTGFTVDETYSPDTADAVSDWQEDMGREPTGVVEAGDAVTAEGARRVAALQTWPGAQAEGAVLDWTGTERVVSVELDAQFEELVRVGTEAEVELPNGTTVDGRVTDIGTPPAATGSGAGSDGAAAEGEEDQESTLPLRLAVGKQDELGRYQAAPVDVVLGAETRENVLAVPVNALVARQGGGYAVQKVSAAGGTESVPVELGMFADGLVEVSGDGIEAGMSVGVPQ
ncbi:peptidoglycan-binding domain-containing protein [Streptomyces sp. WMMC500]|uniref:peptidoglycan-binding domain-containing protein n=1 Tax=Streptomyces sp. WMMC500 TaxID=3015154 RepID=UPI00248D0EA1|nr:peptidoglycan-binding domain-containing protein [Streptomyces sp. WMMC500]WBB61408.1 peptidoglycan-binding domain-containing protein [Streptomyces sp. WMMC500]